LEDEVTGEAVEPVDHRRFRERTTAFTEPSQVGRQPLTKTWQRSRVGTPRDRPRRTDDPRDATAEALVPREHHRVGSDAGGGGGLISCHRRTRVGRRLVPAPRQYNHDVVDEHDVLDHDDNGTDDYDIDDRYDLGKAGPRRPWRGPFLRCPPTP
jgi:hypothetical protein